MQVKQILPSSKEVDRENYIQEQAARRAQSLVERFKDKPFHLQNQDNRFLIKIGSWFCNIVSVILAFYYLFEYAIIFVPDIYLASALAILPLAIWELIKRNAIEGLAIAQFVNKRFSRPRFAVVCMIIAGSIYMTTIGGRNIMEDFSYAPALTSIDSIAGFYVEEIDDAEAQIKTMQNDDGEILWNLRKEAEPVQQQITQLRQQKNDAIAKASADNEANLLVFNYDTKIDAWQFGIVAGSMDILLLLMIGFLVYCDEREHFYLKRTRPELFTQPPAQPVYTQVVHGAELNPVYTPQVPIVQGFVNRTQARTQPVHHTRTQPVYTQVVRGAELNPVDYSRHHSKKGVVEGRINHKTARADAWLTQSTVEGRIKQYEKRESAALEKYERDKTQANKGTLENNQGWLAYWRERANEFYNI